MAYGQRVIVERSEQLADLEHAWATGDEVICWVRDLDGLAWPVYRSRLGVWSAIVASWAR